MQPLPHPEGTGTRPRQPDRRRTPASDPPRPAAGGSVPAGPGHPPARGAVAVVIAICSYAVSATSLYAWRPSRPGTAGGKPAAVPVVARTGPVEPGMFWIVSPSRRGPRARAMAGCWSPAGRLASASAATLPTPQTGHLVARAIAAAFLACAGHARKAQRRRRRGHPPGRQTAVRRGQARSGRPAPARHNRSTQRPHY